MLRPAEPGGGAAPFTLSFEPPGSRLEGPVKGAGFRSSAIFSALLHLLRPGTAPCLSGRSSPLLSSRRPQSAKGHGKWHFGEQEVRPEGSLFADLRNGGCCCLMVGLLLFGFAGCRTLYAVVR